ncbi:MAG: RHS repeat-associated core domain-containing protein, partial [Candidatus Binatia bacterium]
HLGSVVMLTDEDGMVAAEYEYDAYGRRTAVAEAVDQPYAFTGREWDEESGLYYYRARYYDPASGRFLSEDPIGFSGGDANLYRYAGNNPVNWTDPSGQTLVVGLPWALPVLIDALASALPYAIGGTAAAAAAAACMSGDEEKPRCRFEREVYYGGPTKTCVYSKPGQIFTFPQWKEKPCPPIDPVTCLVDTTGLPGSEVRFGGK